VAGKSKPEDLRQESQPGVPSWNLAGSLIEEFLLDLQNEPARFVKTSEQRMVKPILQCFRTSARFAAVSVAAVPVLHFPGLYQKAIPENRPFALNRRGRECRHSGTFWLRLLPDNPAY
jgi:hypothetical protein